MQQHVELLFHEDETVLAATMKRARGAVEKTRIKAIMLRTRGKTPQEIAEKLLVNDRSVRTWITIYNKDGLAGLAPKPSGRKDGNPKWDSTLFDALAKEIDKGGYWSIPKMQDWLKKHFQVAIPEQTVWYRMDKLNYSYKGARPHPVQGNRERQETFKKGASPRFWNKE
jgi:transposase